MADPTLNRTRRTPGLLLLLLVLLPLLISLHLMGSAVQNSDGLSRLFIPLLLFNLFGLLLIIVLIFVNVVRLLGRYRRRDPGSRLTLRMVIVFLMLSLPPAGLVYYYSVDFLHQGIDSWFDVKIDTALEDSLELSRQSLDLIKRQYLRTTEQLMLEIDDISETAMAISLVEKLNRSNAIELTLVDFNGRIIGSSNVNPDILVPDNIEISLIQQVRDGGDIVSILPLGENQQMHVRVMVRDEIRPILMQAIFALSDDISDLSTSVQDAVVRYKELAYLRSSLKFNFSLTLVLVLAFVVLAAVWAAFFSARKLVAPISDIADGTRAVAAGDYEKLIPLQDTHDELSFLVTSFNTMMRRISMARDQAARSQRLVEEQKTYLETVLGHLSSGVMVFDRNKQLQTVNRAAEQIFHIRFDSRRKKSVEELSATSDLVGQWCEKIDDALANEMSEWREEITLSGETGKLVLLTRVSPLLDSAGMSRGRVVVFDDVTELMQAQRNAAWGEVARRLAHEIKNPLTPIQLSAERLRHKYLRTMSEEDARVLDKATHTIVQQVDAMKDMVNAFSDYAKPSRLEVKPVIMDDLVQEVMALYEASAEDVKISIDLQSGSVCLEADPVRLRQVIHNLVKNALEAVAEVSEPAIEVRSGLLREADERYFYLEVLDNGGGFEDNSQAKVFEPYVTSKVKGTGLGLAIVKKIIEEHGGTITASNRAEGGARMLLRLPVINDQNPLQDAGNKAAGEKA
jgi:PAS domain S-box-containing protein